MTWKHKVAIICKNNIHRSMAVQYSLMQEDSTVSSYGTSSRIHIAGRNMFEENVYKFGTTYEYIYDDLQNKDEDHYTRKRVLDALQRNQLIKPAPQRFQDCTEKFDIVIALDKRAYMRVAGHMGASIYPISVNRLYVFKIHISRSRHECVIASQRVKRLLNLMETSKDMDTHIADIVKTYETEFKTQLQYCVFYY